MRTSLSIRNSIDTSNYVEMLNKGNHQHTFSGEFNKMNSRPNESVRKILSPTYFNNHNPDSSKSNTFYSNKNEHNNSINSSQENIKINSSNHNVRVKKVYCRK